METPMLKVDVAKMHKVDTKNVENLFGMWSGTGFHIRHILVSITNPLRRSLLKMRRIDGGWPAA